MNCPACETLLIRDQDGALSVAERAVLNGHLSQCPTCREFQKELSKVSRAYLSESASINVPDIEVEWADLQNRLSTRDDANISKRRRIPAPVFWLSAPLAAAAALSFVFLSPPQEIAVTESSQFDAAAITHVDYVETGDPNASTMVYIDQDSGWLVVWASQSRPNSNG